MVLVHHQVVDLEIGEGGQRRAPLVLGAAQRAATGAEDLGLGEDHQPHRRDHDARRTLPHHDRERVRRVERRGDGRLHVVVAQDLFQVLGLVLVPRHQAHREALGAPAPERIGERGEVRREPRHLLRVEHVLDAGTRHRLQLDARPVAEHGTQRPAVRRLLRGLVEQRRRIEDRRRVGRDVVQQARGAVRVIGRPAERQQEELVEGVGRSLRGGIEPADRFHVVAEELQAHRARVAGGEDVDDAAADAPLPDLDHRLGALVAGRLERFQQQLALEPIAHADPQRTRREVRRRRQRRVQAVGVTTTTSGSPAAAAARSPRARRRPRGGVRRARAAAHAQGTRAPARRRTGGPA